MTRLDPATVNIEAMLKRLHLANARRCWASLTEQAASEQWSHRDFLAFFQYTSGYTFARNGVGEADPAGEFRDKPMLFDPKAEWLMIHQKARPNGTEDILEDTPEPGAAPAGATPGGAPGGGMPGQPGPSTTSIGPAGASTALN